MCLWGAYRALHQPCPRRGNCDSACYKIGVWRAKSTTIRYKNVQSPGRGSRRAFRGPIGKCKVRLAARLTLSSSLIVMSSFGTLFRISSWGESHCASVGVVVEGVPPVSRAAGPEKGRGNLRTSAVAFGGTSRARCMLLYPLKLPCSSPHCLSC